MYSSAQTSKIQYKIHKEIKFRKINKDNIRKLDEDIKSYHWQSILSNLSTEESFTQLHKVILESFNKHMPEKTRVIGQKTKNHEPWLTPGIRKSLINQRKLYRQTLKPTCNQAAIDKYKAHRKILQQVKRKAKTDFYRSRCKEFKNDTKKLWNVVNSVIGKTKKKETIIQSLKIGNIKTTNSKKITTELCNYSANVRKDFANKIPKGNHDIKYYLNKISTNPHSIFLAPTTTMEITKLIGSLKNKDSSGHDGISNKILKGITNSISHPLSIIFNKSMEEGIFPSEMKKADTVSLYKSKARDEKNNYRPISLLLTISKLLEKVIYQRTYKFLTKYDQIHVSQYGFREGHSCQDAIAELVGNIVKNTDEGLYTIGVFLDLSKAFDTLEHEVLYNKLETYGIRGIALEWFKRYLSERKLRVKCMVSTSHKQEYSEYERVEYGTPQGSCLGPLLFLIFSNDLHKHLEYCNNLQFADDTTIYKGHRNLRYLTWCVEQDLNNLNDWFKANKLTLNVDKSVHMVFGKKNNTKTEIKLGDIELPRVTAVKFLGIWMDEHLNWNEHLSKLKLRVKRNLNLLQIGTNMLDPQTKKILYYAQIYSHLSYGLIIWGNMISNTNVDSIQKLQNKCIKKINIREKHVQNIYTKYNLLRIKDILTLENCKLVHRLEHHEIPRQIETLFKTNQQGKSLMKRHNYNTRQKNLPNITRSHCKVYSTSYLCSSIRDYQKLNHDLTKIESQKKFIYLLKNTLLTC